MNSIRLDKFLANSGLASKRKIPELLKAGIVTVNGKVVKEPGLRIDTEIDRVLVKGQGVEKPKLLYYLLNKPKGIISTASDEHGRKTVLDLIPSKERLYPVGRLDKDATGLIILTNDGELANRLTHPRYEVPKTYEVVVSGTIGPEKLGRLRKGIFLREGKTAPAEVEIVKNQGNRTWLEITIHEGRNHQVKRMCEKVGLSFIGLKRTAIGSLKLGTLKSGEYRQITSVPI